MFNRVPLVILVLVGAISLAHVVREFSPVEVQNAMILTLALFPNRWADALSYGDLAAILPSMFGHTFLHGGWIHLLFNMVLTLSVGRGLMARLETGAGASWRFLLIFFGAAALGAVFYVAINLHSDLPALGASGAACGIYAAYLMSVRDDWRESLRDPWVLQNGAVFLALNVGLAFFASALGVLPIAWEAHLGGFIAGALMYPLLAPRPGMQDSVG